MKCTECNTVIRPVVAVDIDGTLGMYHEHFTVFASDYAGVHLPTGYNGGEEFSDYLGMSKQLYREAKLAYRQGGMKRTMPTYGGARGFMIQLNRLGCEVWIATTRPWMRLDNIDPDTREWLQRNTITYDYMLYGEDKYEVLKDRVGESRVLAVVDDLREQCEKAKQVFDDDTAIQPYRQHNEMDQFVNRVYGFDHIHERIKSRVEKWHGEQG